ncbi:MAG: radical SAM protein [Desulfosporosinus sp.]|nr:radical SAM protein [Desulfosporosinus sp.]
MIDVLIINSPIFKDKLKGYDEDSLPPIGLGYIATNMQNSGIEVELLDAFANNTSVLEILDIVENKKPKFVVLNIFSTNYEIVKDIIEECNFETNFIIGGPVTKHIYHDIINWVTSSNIDIVIGDGDYIVTDIVKNALKEEPVEVLYNRRVFKVEYNSCCFPQDISNIPLDRSFFKNEPIMHPRGFIEANLVTSRGCIYNCSFCGAARSINIDLPVRERTTDSIREEIDYLLSLYPQINSIRILDDLFLKDLNNIKKATNLFKNYKLNWRCMAHIKTFRDVSREQIEDLKASGCSELFIGLESGSESILKLLNKNPNVAQTKEVLLKLFLCGINVKGYFIMGFPDETENDMYLTYNLAKQLKQLSLVMESSFRISIFQFRPYHGTLLYSRILDINRNIQPIRINEKLSKNIGRNQFNFSSGNYSQCSEINLIKYIKMMNDLNGVSL